MKFKVRRYSTNVVDQNRKIIHFLVKEIYTICMGDLFQGVTLDSTNTRILLIWKMYVSYSYCYTKITSEGEIYVSYFVALFSNMHFISFFTDDEPVDIILHVPSSHERQTHRLRKIILLSHQEMRSGYCDARCTLTWLAEKPHVLQAGTCTATLNFAVCL
jgi:hypothetical protein